MDVEPKNLKIKDMEEVELENAVEATKGKNRLKKMFADKMDEEEKEDAPSEEKASKLSDFIEVIIRLKK